MGGRAAGRARHRRRGPGTFFRGTFALDTPADTFIDMTGYRKGVVWVNGHNLGRYWDIGPQKRLYCPAPWLKAGENEVIVFDLHQTEPLPLRGAKTLERSVGDPRRPGASEAGGTAPGSGGGRAPGRATSPALSLFR